jgi:hypothetical protein
MTTTETHSPPSGTARPHAALRPVAAIARLGGLYLCSRRVPAALGLLAALGALLAAALYWRLNIAGGPAAQQVIPLTIETAAAAIIAATTYGPFGESERATGRWLPYLRLAAAVLLTAAAISACAAGAMGGHLPGGSIAMIRNLAGTIGIGLLTASALGGAFGWAGPMAYLLLTESALAAGWTSPWVWAAHPPSDIGAALCASITFATGLAVATIRGDRRDIAR